MTEHGKQYRTWLKANGVDPYVFANWLHKHFPGQSWLQCNNETNRAAYLAQRNG